MVPYSWLDFSLATQKNPEEATSEDEIQQEHNRNANLGQSKVSNPVSHTYGMVRIPPTDKSKPSLRNSNHG